MSDILKRYEESDVDNVARARKQSEGAETVNHFDVTDSYSNGFIPNLLDLKEAGKAATEFLPDIMDDQYVVELRKVNQQFAEYNRENKYIEKNPNLPGVINKSK